ncbi:hypothetical protein GWI33_007842 [Rhynchophorus ferrugineus]|uniref:Uncharacterized protein n=1 Tax=Rhynchophorus ferrugineus TaxID=354439 RepID=A0A834MGB7_RHYFE|nr:hypothetical protein GWI33_007842 [Rhynchophorus ferrugineus]
MNTNKNENSDNQISPVDLNPSDESWRDSSVCYCGQHFMPKISPREQESSEEDSSSKEKLSEDDSSSKEESSHEVSVCYCGYHLMGKKSCGLENSSGQVESLGENSSSNGVSVSFKEELSQDGSECYCGLHLKPKESSNREEQSAEDASWGEQSSSDNSSTNEESCDRLEGYTIQYPYAKLEDRKVHKSSRRPSSCENWNEEEYEQHDKANIGFQEDSCPYSAPDYAISSSEEQSENLNSEKPSLSPKDSNVEESMYLPLYVSNLEEKEDSLQKLTREELFYGKPLFTSTPKEGVSLETVIIQEYLENKLMDISLDSNR